MPAPADDVFLIIVVGAMNPSIHHPSWYQIAHILSEEEASNAARGGVVVTSPQVAQFNVGQISVTCDPVRWQIQAISTNDVPRIVEIADKTFKALHHTPVSACGLNFLHHRSVKLKNVAGVLGRKLLSLDLGLIGNGSAEAGKMTYERSIGGKVIRTTIEPSIKGSDHVYVGINIERRFDQNPKLQQFDLKPKEWIVHDQKDAEEQLASILKAMDRLALEASRNGA